MEQVRPKTRTELQQQRKQHLRTLSSNFMEQFYTAHPHIFESSVPINPPIPPLPSTYILTPHVRTKSELDTLRKIQSIQENEKIFKVSSGTNSNPEYIRQSFNLFSQNSRLKKSDRVKQEAAKSYEERFDKMPAGVHGEELPKFCEHLRDYWKLKQGYIESPAVRTPRKESRPISEFCRLRTKSKSIESEITAKPGEVNPFPSFVPKDNYSAGMRNSSRSRFSDEMMMTSKGSSLISIEIGFNTNKTKKIRPSTAQCQDKKSRKAVRSRGFL